ncbi:fibulin-1-like isoform X3 [Anopheles albimanus]|uniref:fibulin-1-like isoform X3 n=1 Tax=Anopheles albimanus TaxID=7167 RepID=UPI0016406404|nr:fibulin-1-like isoform X3 [Anopheles albimanus]
MAVRARLMLLLLLATLALVGSTTGQTIAIEQILSLCCQKGEEWGIQNRLCSSYNNSLELVPAGLHGLCLSTIEICCSKQHKIYQCTAGQIAAKQGLSCSLKGDHSGSEFYTDCCEACKIGLVVGSSGNKCSVEPFAFGSPWDEIYDGCCNDIKSEDINECEEDGACDEGYRCLNIRGSYECIAPVTNYPIAPTRKKLEQCSPGFRRHNEQCVDIDECAADRNACDSNQVCTNEIGGFRCDCKIGFILDSVTNACVDINECQVNAHECLETQRCDNTIGSYTCIRLQSCGTGYTLNAETGNCDDDDECALGRHNCRPPFDCYNTKGSFRCRQRSRYTPTSTSTSTTTSTTTARPYRYGHSNDPYSASRYSSYNPQLPPCGIGFERNSLGACVDINECLDDRRCQRHQQCINTNGSYRCKDLLTCPVGFRANEAATECLDIDECAEGVAQCGPDQTCKNKQGGYICQCPPGHIIGQNQRCEDVDECSMHGTKVCHHNSHCINTIGSFRCECKEGFKKQGSSDIICTDVDECTEIPGLCHQRCLNYWGSYRCGCNPGYRLSYNNRTCDDLDECEEYKSTNLCVGYCENTPGSYACRCPKGYKLGADGRSCIDIDECRTEQVCNGRHEVCTNIGGSYRCTRIECPYGYRHDIDRRNRCERTIRFCQTTDLECLRTPHSYSYNFLTIVSNIPVPPEGRGLFTLTGPTHYDMIDFDLKLVSVDAAPHVRPVDIHYFSLDKKTNEAQVNLRKSIEGPQDIELDFSITVFQNGQMHGTNVAKLFLMISAHEY